MSITDKVLIKVTNKKNKKKQQNDFIRDNS